jgi:hypothetical protein
MPERLTAVDEFRDAKRARERLIVITDTATGHRIHHAWCDDVSEENFVQKVIEGKGKNGAYYVCATPAEAAALGAVECFHCHQPER